MPDKQSNFTQGEWTISACTWRLKEGNWSISVLCDEKHVCYAFGDTKEQAEANARLIANAPKMLDALTKYQDFVKGHSEHLGVEMDEIDNLLAKIRGEL